MNYENIFYENLTKEMDNFKATYNNMEAIQIYNDWYIIGFYESYYELFMSDFLEYKDYEDLYKWLSGFEHPLQFLYNEWLSSDGAFNHNWDMMVDFVETVYKEKQV